MIAAFEQLYQTQRPCCQSYTTNESSGNSGEHTADAGYETRDCGCVIYPTIPVFGPPARSLVVHDLLSAYIVSTDFCSLCFVPPCRNQSLQQAVSTRPRERWVLMKQTTFDRNYWLPTTRSFPKDTVSNVHVRTACEALLTSYLNV
jgi:hypothetical protein